MLWHFKDPHDISPFPLCCFCFQGEVCVASSRVYVQEGIYDELVKKLVEKAKAWIVGDPFDPKVLQGPQV